MCRIMFLAIFRCFGLLFYLLLGLGVGALGIFRRDVIGVV